ncbi:hypothetical protein IBE33_03605 [Francisella philomiragia]|uniref:hypothetical protein n=1 Tax=Francisella philomiragia TaxID=28110 RepID=UPI001906CF58|nr:hypothetical protein [Francisella philomiragia]MBK2340597.1 hypothetical protein [Francisella philomiragia]
MGLINFGAPEKEIDFLQRLMGLTVFVEGGTFKGGTAKQMSQYFSKVYTIEKSDVMYNEAEQNLKDISNITMLKGDTREHLKDILDNNDNILFWLDAHWSGGDTYGEKDECPLIEELGIIFDYPNKNQVILIDDARLFLAPPPYPHNFNNWQSMKDIFNILPIDWSFIEYEDVIYLYPVNIEDKLKEFFQKEVTKKLKSKRRNSYLQKIFKKIGICKCD